MKGTDECRRGLQSKIALERKMCRLEDVVNTAVVLGVTSCTVGHAGLTEFCAALNMPCVASETFAKHQDQSADAIKEVAEEEEPGARSRGRRRGYPLGSRPIR